MVAIKYYPQEKFSSVEKVDLQEDCNGNDEKLDHEHKPFGKKEKPFFYFIRDGDFDLVYTNIIVFIVGHILAIELYYHLIASWDVNSKHTKTLMFGKL